MDTTSYLLGIFDGEGSIRVAVDRRGRWSAYATVAMRERAPVELLRATFGGSIRELANGERAPLTQWKLSGAQACDFLACCERHALVRGFAVTQCLRVARSIARSAPADRRGRNLKLGEKALSPAETAERLDALASLARGKADRYGPSAAYRDDGAVDRPSYLQGVFDAEGTVGTLRQPNGSYTLTAAVTMASEPVVRLLVATFGGGVGCRSKPTQGGLSLWYWQAVGTSARPLLAHTAAHSLTKRPQASLGLELIDNMAKYRDRATTRGGTPNVKGGRFLTDEDLAERERIALAIRALNGARSRFSPHAAD